MTPTPTKKIHEGLYELCGLSIRNCSDNYQRAWAVEKNGNLIRGFATLKESKAWILNLDPITFKTLTQNSTSFNKKSLDTPAG